MAFKAIFWDSDGTLVNTEPLFFEATQKILADVGVELTYEWNSQEALKKNRSAFELAYEKGIDPETIKILRKKRNDLYSKKLSNKVEICNQVIETLQKLHGKINMGVVTMSLREHFNIIMDSTNLAIYFDFFICNEDVIHEKPHPESYLKALKKSGFSKEECLVIEDTERGVKAAKKAGLTCFACPNQLSETNDFSMADKVIKDVSEILPFFNFN